MMNDRAILRLKIKPRSRKTRLERLADGSLCLKIRAVPQKGQANKEIIAFMSEMLKIPKQAITIRSGLTSPLKILSFSGLSEEDLMRRLIFDA